MTVISLCDESGEMVKPWAAAGFDCLCLDIRHAIGGPKTEKVSGGNITKQWGDVRHLTPADLPDPEIIFAFPPCTNLAVSGARWFSKKGLQGLIDGLTLVESCRRLCEWYEVPWMIENPVSRLSSCWRKPDAIFQPWEYGDLYTKKTCVWYGGGFQFPAAEYENEPNGVDAAIWKMSPGNDRGQRRSLTPAGFARAVFDANWDFVRGC